MVGSIHLGLILAIFALSLSSKTLPREKRLHGFSGAEDGESPSRG